MYQLLLHLKSDLQLTKCLKVVGYLRRMQLFSEAELRLKFLQARDSFFQSILQSIPTQDANEHLSKVIELSRTHLFSIVSQYRAVFSDDETSPNELDHFEGTHFFAWINEKVLDFLATVQKDLPLCPPSSLDSLLEQSLYFGLSLSRVGCDFRGLVAPIFIRTISGHFAEAMDKADAKLERDMEKFTLPSVTSEGGRSARSEIQEQAPNELLDYYIFADYCNSILGTFNDLRLCAPLSLVDTVTSRLQTSLCSATQLLSLFQRQEQQALSPGEKQSLARLCGVIAHKLVPHVQKCLHVLFKPDDLAEYFGVDRSQLEKEGLGYLNQSAIIEPISQKFLR
uniref:Conserved oligomeric Golgi complex subunit 8 n=2 Tax=Cacopsylla melanoneura TaxID=428564 RepID=A0A8D8R618_9HEMI